MTEFGKTLLDGISESFAEKVKKDRNLRQISNRIRDGTDYGIADLYSVRVNELLSEAIAENTKTLAYMSEEVAREVLTPLLTADHDMIVLAANTIQKNMNDAAGIGLGIATPDLDTNRIDGFITKVASYDNFDDARWVLEEPLVNYGQAIVDQAMRKNMRTAADVGLRPKIKRTLGQYEVRYRKAGKKSPYVVPCKWCESLAGTYDYAEVSATGSDVFRRHEYCRCEVTYINGAKRQDVWSKAEWTGDDAKSRTNAIDALTRKREREEQERAAARESRLSAIELLQRELGYSAKGAAVTYNKNKGYIERYGIDWFIAWTRETNPYARQSRAYRA